MRPASHTVLLDTRHWEQRRRNFARNDSGGGFSNGQLSLRRFSNDGQRVNLALLGLCIFIDTVYHRIPRKVSSNLLYKVEQRNLT